MTKRIFQSIVTVALAVFLATTALVMGVLYNYFTQVQQSQLQLQTAMTGHAVTNEGLSYLKSLELDGSRITWIDADGNVIYDSSSAPEQMENHMQREEIQEALEHGYGESQRYSGTLAERYLFSAQRLQDGTVLRLGCRQRSFFNLLLSMIQPIILIFTVTALLSMLLASRLARRVVKPLNELSLDNPMSNTGYKELTPLLRRIDSQQKQLRLQASELQQKQDEFCAVTDNMSESLILLNPEGNILSLNPAAARLMDIRTRCVGRNIRTIAPAEPLQGLISQALAGRHSGMLLTFPAGTYQADASPVCVNGKVTGVALLLFDVTEQQKSEAIRREFTANVSHELKTPLHSISGYAELLCAGLVQPQDIPKFTGQIYTEAQRMIHLVEDIIRLSRLDENQWDSSRESVDLYALAEEVLDTLSSAAAKNKVTTTLRGRSATVLGFRQLLETIIANLCSNAIKYNRPDGTVTVTVCPDGDCVLLIVRDTGIGIPQEHQSRIFERFYRVDKSHSKQVGGTGLGLSIVKHAALIHNATIDLQSTEGKGTTITVRFPAGAQ